MSKKILLSTGEYTIVDDEDWLFLVGFTWSISNSGYAQTRIDGKKQYMHQIVAERVGIDCSNEIDHVNRNKLDNRRCNLRAATSSQNSCNSKRHCDNTSGIKGVCWHKSGQKWAARIMVEGKHIHLGLFNTKEAAAFAYQEAAKKYHGEFARIT